MSADMFSLLNKKSNKLSDSSFADKKNINQPQKTAPSLFDSLLSEVAEESKTIKDEKSQKSQVSNIQTNKEKNSTTIENKTVNTVSTSKTQTGFQSIAEKLVDIITKGAKELRESQENFSKISTQTVEEKLGLNIKNLDIETNSSDKDQSSTQKNTQVISAKSSLEGDISSKKTTDLSDYKEKNKIEAKADQKEKIEISFEKKDEINQVKNTDVKEKTILKPMKTEDFDKQEPLKVESKQENLSKEIETKVVDKQEPFKKAESKKDETLSKAAQNIKNEKVSLENTEVLQRKEQVQLEVNKDDSIVKTTQNIKSDGTFKATEILKNREFVKDKIEKNNIQNNELEDESKLQEIDAENSRDIEDKKEFIKSFPNATQQYNNETLKNDIILEDKKENVERIIDRKTLESDSKNILETVKKDELQKEPFLASVYLSKQKQQQEKVSQEAVKNANDLLQNKSGLESVKKSAEVLELNMQDLEMQQDENSDVVAKPKNTESAKDDTIVRNRSFSGNQLLNQMRLQEEVKANNKKLNDTKLDSEKQRESLHTRVDSTGNEDKSTQKVQTNVEVKPSQKEANATLQNTERKIFTPTEADVTVTVPSELIETFETKIVGAKQKVSSFMSEMARNMYLNYKPPLTAFRMVLNPNNLGSIEIVMKKNAAENSLSVSMNMNNSNTAELFTENKQVLQNALMKNLGENTNITIDLGMQNNNSNESQNNSQNNDNANHRNSQGTSTGIEEVESDEMNNSSDEYM